MLKKINRGSIIFFIKSFAVFVLVGIGNAILDFILFLIFSFVLFLPVLVSQNISYALATLNRYLLNKFIKYGGKPSGQVLLVQLPRFTAVSIFVAGFSSVLMIICINIGFNELISKGIVSVMSMFLNAASYKYMIFKPKE